MNKRPININPLSIKLPVAALVSITHRVSGLLVFLLIPALLWALQTSLSSPSGFEAVRNCITQDTCRIILWVSVAAIAFHVVAGIRHLLMDVHIGDSKTAGRMGAYLVILVTLVVMAAAFWMWG